VRWVIPACWIRFTEDLEGGVPWLYADIRNLLTIAYGNLVDPMSAALALPFVRPDGSLATTAEITTKWLTVKGDPNAATRGHLYARGLTNLRLTPQAMTDLALGKLDDNNRILRTRLPDWDSYPACAQMALHSLAWACGPGFHFPKLVSAVKARDWDAASVHIQMREVTPEGIVNAGLRPRNARNRILMLNAARVDAFHLDADLLNWDAILGVQDADTQPDIHLPSSIPPPLPVLNTPIMPYPAAAPTVCPAPLPEEVTGSGGTLHPLSYDVDPDPEAA
jgi:GH24 family phage-related lysozyme (muramidase)